MLALSAAPPLACGQGGDPMDGPRRVVILNATDPYLPAFLALDGALREAIRAGSQVPAEIYAETLDMYRFPRQLLDQDVVALLRKKYRDLRVDVVVADAAIALDFARHHRADIWPGAVIVFNSVPSELLRGARLDARTIGVPVQLDFGPTLDLALKLRPATREIVVVAGTADPDKRQLSLARASVERYAAGLDVEYLVGLTLADTLAAVRALPADALVLFLTVFRDGSGAPQVPREVLRRVAAVSRAPIFGVFETYLGDGIVAGSIASFGAQGRRAGELVARVLNGEDPAAIGVQQPIEPECVADWQQLGHWRIDEDLLPAGCELRFKQVTAWDQYRWPILIALAVFLFEAALIAALLLNRRRLRRAQATLSAEYARRAQAEGLAARLRGRLARFARERSLGTMATSISHEINQPLIAIQNYAQAARRRLQNDVDDKPKLVELFEKIECQAERAGAITQRVRSLVGASDVQLQALSLCPLFEAVVRMMETETSSRGCHIVCESVDELPAVLADALPVQLILVNLVQNAIQSVCATEGYDKRVLVDARRVDEREVQVSVKDQGPGVPPERVADIFEPLYSGTRGGMGMGLAIAQTIVEAHGGRLWYEPNPVGGAIFRFTLRTAGS